MFFAPNKNIFLLGGGGVCQSFQVFDFLNYQVCEFPSFQVSKFTRKGGREDQWEAWNWSCHVRANERPNKTAPNGVDWQTDKQTHGHGDSLTNSAKWGRVGENHNDCPPFVKQPLFLLGSSVLADPPHSNSDQIPILHLDNPHISQLDCQCLPMTLSKMV